ncbi:hypothetical protein FQR65_LT15659 [Abscondita terminalis]|nr:hypothetical protein FQR65_LT15659 [Abscondita terminalis]
MEKSLDVIVFGATGYTGKRALPYILEFNKGLKEEIKWGIAGRSQRKLKAVLKETEIRCGVDNLSDIPIILADVIDEDSILTMTGMAKVIINCCGPYEKYGEVVIKSCIESGTHYVDVSGEFFLQELVEMKYQQAAEVKGVYIVQGCGFGSVGSELGLSFLNEVFVGTLNSVEIYMALDKNTNDTGPLLHYGTWESSIEGMGTMWNFLKLKKSRNLTPLPKVKPVLWPRLPFSKAVDIGKPNKYIIPTPSPDHYVAERTQRFFYENNRKRPIQLKYYTLMNSWVYLLMTIFYASIVFIMAQFQFGRKLLLKYPELFSNGFFSHADPSEETINNSVVNMYFYGKGWSEKLADPQDQYQTPPNKSVTVELKVLNAGYGFTCIAVVLAALTILNETEKFPQKGGVYTPTVAFHNTSYMKEIQKKVSSIRIVETKNL